MLQNPLILLLIAGAVAAALAYYLYHASRQSRGISFLLAGLRFLSIFVVLLLLLNPKVKKKNFETIKTSLPILIDNSSSINYLHKTQELAQAYSFLKEHKALNQAFATSFFSFGSELNSLDTLDFSEGQTLITPALESIGQLYNGTNTPILLLTDGNQTSGRDYTYYASQVQQEVYPIVYGDTTKYPDLRIDKINVNRFSYLHNDFPVEVQLSIHGIEEAQTKLEILHNENVVHQETLTFKDANTSLFTQIHLPAYALGLQSYELRLKPLNQEKNLANNSQNFAVDVLDSSGKVALVSDISHPDLGVIKRSIEANTYLEVKLLTVHEAEGGLSDYNLVILYQPEAKAEVLLREIVEQGLHVLYITGIHTDWLLLNSANQAFSKRARSYSDLVQGRLDTSFDLFLFDDIDFEQLAPLETQSGMLEFFVPHQSLLEEFVSGQRTGSALLAVYEEHDAKRGILDAQGIWRWRAGVYEKDKSFEAFDSFLQGLVQYLSSTQEKKRLQVYFDNFYYQNSNAKLRAQYFDSNFQLDRQASLEVFLFKEDSLIKQLPMTPTGLHQEIGIDKLKQGAYSFKIVAAKSKEEASGRFEILAYAIENKFDRAAVEPLEILANTTGGQLVFSNDLERFVENLIKQKQYQIKERAIVEEIPLIDYTFLLGVFLISLALEWFLRKYHGLL